jgi:hypothetical protein
MTRHTKRTIVLHTLGLVLGLALAVVETRLQRRRREARSIRAAQQAVRAVRKEEPFA